MLCASTGARLSGIIHIYHLIALRDLDWVKQSQRIKIL